MRQSFFVFLAGFGVLLLLVEHNDEVVQFVLSVAGIVLACAGAWGVKRLDPHAEMVWVPNNPNSLPGIYGSEEEGVWVKVKNRRLPQDDRQHRDEPH